MSKIPAFQFYPADWRKDIGVQSLSYHDRGVWHEMLCLMHESEQRGVLLLNGNAMPTEVLARVLGLDKQSLEQTLEKLLSYGVASIDGNGALFSRRMVKDEADRKANNNRQKKFYENSKPNNQPNAEPNGNLTLIQQKSNSPLHSSSSDNVSKETASSPPVIEDTEEPVNRRIWTDGVLLLKKDGVPEKSARSLLGSLAGEYGKETLAECIAAAQASNPAETKTYLIATLKSKKKNSGPSEKLKSATEVLAEREKFMRIEVVQ